MRYAALSIIFKSLRLVLSRLAGGHPLHLPLLTITSSIACFAEQYYIILAESPSVARVLNGLTVDAVYPILLLYPPETPVPFLSYRNLILGSLLHPWHANSCWILYVKVYILSSLMCSLFAAAGHKMAAKLERKKHRILFKKIDTKVYKDR